MIGGFQKLSGKSGGKKGLTFKVLKTERLEIQTQNLIIIPKEINKAVNQGGFTILSCPVYGKILPVVYHLFYFMQTCGKIDHIMPSGITTAVCIEIFAHTSDFLPENHISCFTVSIAWISGKGEKRFPGRESFSITQKFSGSNVSKKD